jgi:erythromycin esterase-like protein
MEFHGDAKGIIWEHNTHIGDARATDMAQDGTIRPSWRTWPEECFL